MRVKITGISGYLGTIISKNLEKKGHQVSGIHRHFLYGPVNELAVEISNCDAIINLAGASILQRWTKSNALKIYHSRVLTTHNLVQAINLLDEAKRPTSVLSASAVGIYENNKLHNESSKAYASGFVGKVVKDWEEQLEELPESVRLSVFRIGLVLGSEAKTIKNLKLPFSLGLGGPIASGKQAFPFIHETDLANAVSWILENAGASGVFNLVAPEQINNRKFTQMFADIIGRPAFIPVPSFVLRIIFGKAASLLLKSPAVEPRALLDGGFTFKYPTVELALEEILEG